MEAERRSLRSPFHDADGRPDRYAHQPDRGQQARLRIAAPIGFARNVITKVPFPHPGVMRDVYPGFLQLNGFVSMNLDRHLDAHKQLFFNLVKGDGDLGAEASRVL